MMAATTRENTCPRCEGLLNPRGPCPHCGWPEKEIGELNMHLNELSDTILFLERKLEAIQSKASDMRGDVGNPSAVEDGLNEIVRISGR